MSDNGKYERARSLDRAKRQRLDRALRQARSEHDEEYTNDVVESSTWPSPSDALAVHVNSMLQESAPGKSDDHSTKLIPIAPTISAYLEPGATKLYRPRLEWLTSTGVPNRKRQRDSSPAQNDEHEQVQDAEDVAAPPQQAPAEPAIHRAPNNGQLTHDLFLRLFFGNHQNPQIRNRGPEAEAIGAALRNRNHAQIQEQGAAAAGLNVAAFIGNHNHAQHEPTAAAAAAVAESPPIEEGPHRGSTVPSIFGKERDSALHVAIREGSTEAAIALVRLGAPVGVHNVKRVTPLILASQKGNYEVVKLLLEHGANPLCTSITGSTALLQAAHFGYETIVSLLLENGSAVEGANFKNTTPLMRASQEGHELVVRTLLESNAEVNRRNNEHMSALMLASQRGHDHIVRILLKYNADVNAMTAQKSTSLMLACKREHIAVVRVLVAAGCELNMKDTRGRTAKDVARRRGRHDIMKLLLPGKQVQLMQMLSRVARNHVMVKMWTLLQQDRATLKDGRSIHAVEGNEEEVFVDEMALNSNEALVRTMKLPAPLVEHIATYMPLSHLWDQRLSLLTRKCGVDANLAIYDTLDLIDEVLEEGHFLHACDMLNMAPPPHFSSWVEWSSWGFRHNDLEERPIPSGRANAVTASLPGLPRLERGLKISPPDPMNARDWRRGICYLQILAHRTPQLAQMLTQPPFSMPCGVVNKLITINDIQSLSRRMGTSGTRFDPTVAIEAVMLASSVVSWFHSEMKWQEQGPNWELGHFDG